MSEFDDYGHVRPNYLAVISVVSGLLALFGQLFTCLLCWMPLLGWIPLVVMLVGTTVGLLTGVAGRTQAQQTGIGAAAADVGIALGLINLGLDALICLGFMTMCGFPVLLSVMDV